MQAPKIENPKFFQILKKAQIIPEDFIDDLLEELEGNALDVLATLIQSGAGSKRQLCQIWCDSIGIAHVDLEKSLFQPHVVRKIPERSARLLYAIPVYQMGDTITVATATPDNETIKKEITRIVEGPINLVFALPQDIEWAIENAYQTNTTLYEFFKKIKTSKAFEADDPITEKNLTEIAGPEAVNQLHVCLILFGITENTSEIQIEPEKDFATIHFIVDQKVQKQIKLQTSVYRSLVSSLKRLAKLEADEKSEPQYARILFPTPRKKIDIRFLSLPHDHGEKIFLKLMDRSPHKCVFDLSGLYLSHKNLDALRRLINPLSGLLLVTGPLGSGKTTLAYSILRELRGSNVRMMSVEDSIRFLLKGIDQYQVNPQADCTKTAVTEACLKLHPKVLYIQNLEDTEITQSLRQGIESEKLLSSFYIFASEIKQKQEILLSEISVFSNNLDSIKSKHSSAIETFKKLSEIELKESFYRISFSSEEKEELLELSKAIKILRNPQPFYKAIYEIYYKNKVSDLVNRVVGKGRVSGIYKLTHISSGKCYIGKSVDIGER